MNYMKASPPVFEKKKSHSNRRVLGTEHAHNKVLISMEATDHLLSFATA